MKTLMEPTDENISYIAVNPGVHYLIVEEFRLTVVRQRVYDAIDRGKQFSLHTHYDRVRRILRVTVST